MATKQQTLGAFAGKKRTKARSSPTSKSKPRKKTRTMPST